MVPSRDGYIDLRSTIGDHVVDVEDFFDVNSMRVTELDTSATTTPNEIPVPASSDGGHGVDYMSYGHHSHSNGHGSPGGPGGARPHSNRQSSMSKSKQEIVRKS